MKATDMKKALDPHVKKASQGAVKKIKTNINKQSKLKNMTPKKEEGSPKRGAFDDLRDIVTIKKQKAVANELDSLIYDQNQDKEKREGNPSVQTQQAPSLMQNFLSQNPEKIKDMSIEEIAKLSMMTNSSGGSNPMSMMMALGELLKNNNNNGGGGNSNLTDKILGVVIEKMFDDNNNNKKPESSGNDRFMEYMLQQNAQTQQLLLKMMEQKNAPPAENKNNLVEKLFGMMEEQKNVENTYLRDKLRDMESRNQPTDSLGETKKVMEFMNTFKSFFGGSPQTPETLNHELKIKEMDFEQDRQLKEEGARDSRMKYIGDMINNTINTFGKALSEPIIDAAKTKVEKYAEGIKNPTAKPTQKVSPEALRQEIDLGDLEAMEDELAQMEIPLEQNPKKPRFKVMTTDDN